MRSTKPARRPSSRPGPVDRRSSPTWSDTPSRFTTDASTSPCTSPSRWWDTSSVSSPRRGPSSSTPDKNGREALMPNLTISQTRPGARAQLRFARFSPTRPARCSTWCGASPSPRRHRFSTFSARRGDSHREVARLGRRQRGRQRTDPRGAALRLGAAGPMRVPRSNASVHVRRAAPDAYASAPRTSPSG